MGSAGAVKQMEHFFDETFVVVGCDDLTDFNLDRLVAFHRKSDCARDDRARRSARTCRTTASW